MIDLTPDIFEAILLDISAGETTTNSVATHGINERTFRRRMAADPILADRLAHARKRHVERYAEDLITLADSNEDPAKVRNQINVRQWLLERMLRNAYGAKLDVTVTERIELGGALIDARKRGRLLPVCDQQMPALAQVTEYTDVTPIEPSDKQSVPSAGPIPDLS